MDIFSILTMIGGLALFLYGMHVMSTGLARTSGSKLEEILERFTSSPVKAVLLGAGVTAVIQSSSATTVMVVGFVNAGVMKLSQAVGVIMGANVGTTITSWLLSLTGISGDNIVVNMFKPSSFAPILAIIGVCLVLFAKSKKKNEIGIILSGFAILMIGMSTMSDAVKPLADVPGFTKFFTMFGDMPILGVLVGAGLTAIIQSSSASIGILQALCLTGSISYAAVIPIIMGQNIGTCVTALLSSIGASKNAKRAAFVHFYFNLLSTIIFMVVFYLLNAFIHFQFLDSSAGVVGIAVLHSCFNVAATLILLPFRNLLERIAVFTVRDSQESESEALSPLSGLKLLDDRFLNRPAFAVAQAKKASVEMALAAKEALDRAIELINRYDDREAEQVFELEDMINHYEDELGKYLLKLGNADLSQRDSETVSIILHCIGDFERISDHARNIVKTAEEKSRQEGDFSEKAQAELAVYNKAIRKILSLTCDGYIQENSEIALEVEPLRDVIDTLDAEMETKHIKRLRKGKCTIELGFLLTNITTDYGRIADHCSKIAACLIRTRAYDKTETYEYLDSLRDRQNPQFVEKYKIYRKKYKLPG